MRKWIGVILAVGLLAGLSTPAASAVDFAFSGSLTPGDPDQTGRLLRPGVASTCANEGTASLFTATEARNYDAFTFRNGSSASCVTVIITTPCLTAVTEIYVAAYTAFNPANPAENVLGQAAWSPNSANPTRAFSFDLLANQSVTIVVSQVAPVVVGCFAYSGSIRGLSEGATTPATFRSMAAARTSTGVMVRWSTASEPGLLGFNVYREVNGARVRVNRGLIAGKGGGRYSYLDRKAPSGKTLRYWVQAVDLDGSRSWYGPARIARRT